MKYAITHCYTDKNKGDAAIIIATTQLIRSVDSEAEISFYSTFGPNDERFKTDHKIIRPHCDQLFPGLFSQPVNFLWFTQDSLRIFSFLHILLKSMLLLVSGNEHFLKLFLSREEREGVRWLLGADVVISKGGSYLTTQNNSIRQTFSLMAMLYPFVFARRYRKKIVIFSQSLGPLVGNFNEWLYKAAISRVDAIYLRERLCLTEYPVVREVCERVPTKIIPDSAFFLEDVSEPMDETPEIDPSQFNVGYTIVDHAFKYVESDSVRQAKRDNYKNAIIASMTHLLEKRDAIVHIFPQVIVENSHHGHNDVKLSKEIAAHFAMGPYAGRVRFYEKDFSPTGLRRMYAEMRVFIGTRLHSVIFALTMLVPSINISYHGTKSKGIFAEILGFDDYVIEIDEITSEKLVSAVDRLCENREPLRTALAKNIASIRESLLGAMREVAVMGGRSL